VKNTLWLAWNDVRLTVRDKPAFIWLVVLPIAMMWFFGAIGGGGDRPLKLTLDVVNQDEGWLARALVDELRSDTVDLTETDGAKPIESRRRLVIPAGFSEGVLGGHQQKLQIEHAKGGDGEANIAAQAHVIRAIARTLGRLATATVEGSPSSETYKEVASRPPLVELAVSKAGHGTAVPSGRAQSVPGMLTMTVMMMTLIYGAVYLTIEKQSGMLKRQTLVPLGTNRVILAKLIGRLLIAGMQIALLVVAGHWLFGVSWGHSPAGLVLLLTSYAIAVASLATLLGAVVRNAAQASAVGWIIGMILAALGGCWWPSEVMPNWMRAASHVLPTAWAMDGFHGLISFGHGFQDVLVPSAALLGFGGAFSLLAARLLRVE
jgi:ABC-type multidrug transport system permease subunit